MSTAAESDSLTQYRSISSLAVLALLFGLASPLALVNPLLLAVPVAAIVLAMFALRQIAANVEILSGQGLALVALFAGVGILVYTPVRLYTRNEVLNGTARQLAEAFLELLKQGKLQEAHQLANLKYVTPSPGSPPEDFTNASKLTLEDFTKFRETPSIKNIEACQSKFEYRFDAVESTPARAGGNYFVLRYQLIPEASTGKPPFPIWISISRTPDVRTGLPKWKIYKMDHVFKPDE